MFILQFPAMAAAFIPVVLIEAEVFRRALQARGVIALKASVLSNLVSTVLGVPVSWVLMVILGIVTTGGRALGLSSLSNRVATVVLQAAWLPPYEEDFYWLVPIATIVLLVPAYFLSVIIERVVLYRVLKDKPKAEVSRACWLANSASYLVLVLAAGGWLLWSLQHWRPAT
jgi:hypothetical protein